MRIKLIAFDVYGTLFDVSSLRDHVSRYLDIEDIDSFLNTWRSKQIEYSFLVSLMGWFEDFRSITLRALKYSLKLHGVKYDSVLLENLMDGWNSLKPFQDTVEAIPKLSERVSLVTLTNGTREMISSLLGRWGLDRYFREFLSVTDVKIYKPDPLVYKMVERLGVELEEALMVSSNPWDVAGAVNAGMATCFLNRRNVPIEELDLKPHIEVRSLNQLVERLDNIL